MTIIENFIQKIKYHGRVIYFLVFLPIILVLALLLYFGGHSRSEMSSISLTLGSWYEHIEESDVDSMVYASKIGSNYYYSWCHEYKELSQKYLIVFESHDSAEREGYKLAKECPAPPIK